eukprot:6184702-Pleurochrysis_carterae.AAC.1
MSTRACRQPRARVLLARAHTRSCAFYVRFVLFDARRWGRDSGHVCAQLDAIDRLSTLSQKNKISLRCRMLA